MSTEEDELVKAQSLLEETQKRCENYKSFGKKKKNLVKFSTELTSLYMIMSVGEKEDL